MPGPKAEELSAYQARSIALAAQGLQQSGKLVSKELNIYALRRTFQDIGVLQIDAVSVVARSHLLVLRSRLGSSQERLLEVLNRSAYKRRDLTEYWCHEASYLPVQDWPLFKWRMQEAQSGKVWKGIWEFVTNNRKFVEAVHEKIRDLGPSSAGQLGSQKKKGSWWSWSDTKIALEWLFWVGAVAVSHRENFTRFYDLSERVLPAEILGSALPANQAQRELILKASRHLGVATAEDLVDYHRLPKVEGKKRVGELAEDKLLREVVVEGWDRPGYLHPKTSFEKTTSRSVLLSPFDPLVWFRPRARRLFDFDYRLEIYIPAEKRIHGYYVLPFLDRNKLRARVDVKANSEKNILEVRGAYGEGRTVDQETAESLAHELQALASWRNLDGLKIGKRGNLANPLKRILSK
ncbi:MAG: winged helix DNA-binding domain-containing protein [Acidimicrobiales bacterium]|nr:winged helix DNA-binding domain-containing protein [Acidimicrobiales bacterium]